MSDDGDSDTEPEQTEFTGLTLSERKYEYDIFDEESKNISQNTKVLLGLQRYTELYNYFLACAKLPPSCNFLQDDLRLFLCEVLDTDENYVFLFRKLSKSFIYNELSKLFKNYGNGDDDMNLVNTLKLNVIAELKNKFKNYKSYVNYSNRIRNVFDQLGEKFVGLPFRVFSIPKRKLPSPNYKKSKRRRIKRSTKYSDTNTNDDDTIMDTRLNDSTPEPPYAPRKTGYKKHVSAAGNKSDDEKSNIEMDNDLLEDDSLALNEIFARAICEKIYNSNDSNKIESCIKQGLTSCKNIGQFKSFCKMANKFVDSDNKKPTKDPHHNNSFVNNNYDNIDRGFKKWLVNLTIEEMGTVLGMKGWNMNKSLIKQAHKNLKIIKYADLYYQKQFLNWLNDNYVSQTKYPFYKYICLLIILLPEIPITKEAITSNEKIHDIFKRPLEIMEHYISIFSSVDLKNLEKYGISSDKNVKFIYKKKKKKNKIKIQ